MKRSLTSALDPKTRILTRVEGDRKNLRSFLDLLYKLATRI